jgi:DNA-binding HxlR family transcriptional regulator
MQTRLCAILCLLLAAIAAGLITSMVFPTVPPRVVYELTRLGGSPLDPASELGLWVRRNRGAIQEARRRFDAADGRRAG